MTEYDNIKQRASEYARQLVGDHGSAAVLELIRLVYADAAQRERNIVFENISRMFDDYAIVNVKKTQKSEN